MNRFLAVAAILLLPSCATATQSAEREIRAQYDKLERAFAAQDIPAILSIRDPRLEVFGPNGEYDDYARMAEYTRRWFVMNKPPIETKITMQSVEAISPDEMAVNVLQRASRYQEREGKLRRVEHEVTQRETWVRTPDGWKIRKVDQIDLKNRKRWIDGVLEAPAPQR
jgi:ketosteroid isomerase-like protein